MNKLTQTCGSLQHLNEAMFDLNVVQLVRLQSGGRSVVRAVTEEVGEGGQDWLRGEGQAVSRLL